MAEEQNTTAEEYENQEQTASGEGDENLRKLFLGGLKRSITKEDLEEHFRAQGDVVNISLATDNQNVSKGFGFVTMRTVEDTDKILRAHEDKTTELQGRKIEVRRAIPRNSNVPSDVVKKVFVAGLNRGTITEDDLRDYFNTIAEVKSVSIVMDKNTNQSKGFAFVEMEYFYMVDKAALMTNHFVNGTKIDVNKAHADKGGRGGGRGGFGGGRGGRGGGGFGRGGGSGYGSYYSGRDWGNGYSDYDGYGGGGYDDYYGGGMSGYGPQRSYGSRGRGRGGRGGGYRPY